MAGSMPAGACGPRTASGSGRASGATASAFAVEFSELRSGMAEPEQASSVSGAKEPGGARWSGGAERGVALGGN